jgi:hypothetical protein
MAELNLEDLLTSILAHSKRQRVNPSGNVSTAQGALDEMPVSVTVAFSDVVTTPIWAAPWPPSVGGNSPFPVGYSSPTTRLEDHFTNTTASDILLESHTPESGHTWVKQDGGSQVASTLDYVTRISPTDSANSRYTVTMGSGDVHIEVRTQLVPSSAGILFRHSGGDYWRFYAQTDNKYDLQRVGSQADLGIATDVVTGAANDLIEIDCIGNVIVISQNKVVVWVEEDSVYASNTQVGMQYAADIGVAGFDDFQAWELTGTPVTFDTDPGHVFYGGPETW